MCTGEQDINFPNEQEKFPKKQISQGVGEVP
jgi:hypothetical protein